MVSVVEGRHLLLPLRMERSFSANSFVPMGAEVIALGGCEVLRKVLSMESVVIAERSGHCRHGYSLGESKRNNFSPCSLSSSCESANNLFYFGSLDFRVRIACALEPLKYSGTDDAATAPDASHFTKVGIPLIGVRGMFDEMETLVV